MSEHMKRILVALDGSEHGYHAVETAVELARDTNATLAIIHVAPRAVVRVTGGIYDRTVLSGETSVRAVPLPESTSRQLTREGLEVLERTREMLDELGVKADFIVAGGDPVEEIAKEAGKGYDLLILGFEGVGRRRFGIGSVGGRVLDRAPCSVLVVK